MGMKSYSAPGPDGFQAIFFKMYWDDVGEDVWHFVREAFASGTFNSQVTDTLVVLIPKVEPLANFKDFRPISLCNVIYKLISKVLVNRMRPLLARIVSPLLSNFIPGGGTMDNAIILEEVLHHMHKSKRKKGDIILKLDLEKAYDWVEWTFLRDTLTLFRFPPIIIDLIMHAITSSSLSLLWSGCRTSPFNPTRGLRQGDPLSPYLFVLCMERLGAMIESKVRHKRWEPVYLPGNGPPSRIFSSRMMSFCLPKLNQLKLE